MSGTISSALLSSDNFNGVLHTIEIDQTAISGTIPPSFTKLLKLQVMVTHLPYDGHMMNTM